VLEPNEIKSIIFDVGGTLAYDEPNYADGFAAMMTGLGIPTSAEAYRNASTAAHDDLPPAPTEVEEWRVWSAGYRSAILKRLGVPNTEFERIDQMVARRFLYYTRARTYPESMFVLRCLRWAGYEVGIISNISPVLPYLLAELGITRYIDFAVASDTFGVAKPDPTIFYEGLRLAKQDARHCMYVGDGMEPDVMGSSGVGMLPVLIDRDELSTDEDVKVYGGFRVLNLVEIMDWLGVDPWNQDWLHDETLTR
jgi:HAD superfamily hydrolase (TIGR01549 family)